MKNDQIKEYINTLYNYPTHLAAARIKFLLNKEEIKIQCEKDLAAFPEWKTIQNILLGYYYEIDDLLTCSICGKKLSIERTIDVYKNPAINHEHLCCSKKCSGILLHRNKDEINKKIQQTCLAKYGVDNAAKSIEIKNKIKQVCLEKYGVENVFQAKEIKEKIKQTNLNRYGIDYIQKLDSTKEKIRQTNLIKYGVVAPLQNKDVQEKSKQTCLAKYGVEYSLQNKDVQEKSKQTCLTKYGVEYTGANPKRIKQILSHSWESILLWKDYVIPLFSKDEWQGTNKNIIYNWKCAKCGNIFETNFIHTFNKNRFNNIPVGFENIPRCKHCFPVNSSTSLLEQELYNFCKQYYPLAQHNVKFISPYEVDILIDELKLAIEFNGIYWHSDEYKDSNYHLNKLNLCQNKGYKLIHIWENDWIYKKDIVKNRLKVLFNKCEEIYARKCIIKEISVKDKNEFLEQYHIQGTDRSSIKLGLFYQNELYAVMTFGKPRFNKHYEYELIRYASKGRVIGGAGKLLNYFEKIYHPKSLITYADKCWSQGNLYKKLGFKQLLDSNPSYFWCKNDICLTRYQTQKSKLKVILKEKYNPDLSESNNMLLNGFYKVFDCGNLVFEKCYEKKI